MSIVEASSGAAGGVFSVVAMCPLDLAKTRRQIYGKKGGDPRYATYASSLKTIYGENGLAGMYTGIGPKCLQNAIMNFGQFYWMSAVKGLYFSLSGAAEAAAATGRAPKLAPLTAVWLNMLASMLNQSTNTPLENISTRIQAGTGGGGFLGTVRKILQESGPAGLWKGLAVSLVVCINPAINYAVLDILRPKLASYLRRRRGLPAAAKIAFSLWQSFWLGVIAKAITTVLTMPTIRTKVMVLAGVKAGGGAAKNKKQKVGGEVAQDREEEEKEERERGDEPPGALAIMRDVYEREGIRGWYLGIEPQILNASIKSGLMIMTKDRIKGIVVSFLKGLGAEAAGGAAAK